MGIISGTGAGEAIELGEYRSYTFPDALRARVTQGKLYNF